MKKIRIFIVDDHPVIRLGISKLVEFHKDMEICGEAGNVNEAIALIERKKPDVVIVDIIMDNGMSGIDLVKAIANRHPQIITIINTSLDESIYAERAIRAGARGYIQKNLNPQKIADAIRLAVSGGIILSDALKDRLLYRIFHECSQGKSGVDALTNREFEILHLIGEGYSLKEIAKKLNLSKSTVETHRRHIKEKLNIRNNCLLIKFAVEWGMAKIPNKGIVN